MAESGDARDLLLNQIADEFAARHRAGERPRLEEYCERHPELADDIRSLFPALIELERAKAEAGPELVVEFKDAPPFTQLGDFRLLREVGRGGMGVVYEAEQLSLGRRVAIKLLPASVFRDLSKKRRFEREAKAAAKLHHTNIVPVHGVGEHNGIPYYVMQFIPGLGLDSVIDELRRLPAGRRMSEPTRLLSGGRSTMSVEPARSSEDKPAGAAATLAFESSPTPASNMYDRSSVVLSGSGVHLPGQAVSSADGSSGKKSTYWESVARIGVQVGGALSYAHKLGVLHRDIKPANLMLDLDGIVWVTDFGLAKLDDAEDLTHTGDVLGTLRYMPPEAFEGKWDVRSDIYSLGLTLFELVALRPAYEVRDRNMLIKEVTLGDPPRLRKIRRDAPRDLVTIIEKACDREPSRRYQTAIDLAADLQLFLDGRPIIARRATELERIWMWSRRRPATAGLVAALTLCLLLGSVASTWLAFRAERFSRDADMRATEAMNSRDDAEREKRRADITLADMSTSRGILAAEREHSGEAALWFAAAADQSAAAVDPQRANNNRLRARNWMRQAVLPVAAVHMPCDIVRVEFQPRGQLLLMLRSLGKVTVWAWREGNRLTWAEELSGVVSARFSPDGTSLALGFDKGGVQIRTAATGEIVTKIPYGGSVGALSYTEDGTQLAIASHSVRIWDIGCNAFLEGEWEHPMPVDSISFNRKGCRLVTTTTDKRVRVFESDRKEPLFQPIMQSMPHPPALIDEDRSFVTISAGTELSRWDMATGKPVSEPIRTKSSSLHRLVASPDGKWFAAGGNYGPELFSTDGKQSPVYLGHTNSVHQFAFSPDSTKLLSVSSDQTARLWSVPLGKPIGPPLKHMNNAEKCAWSSDGKHFATMQFDGLVRVWQLPPDEPVIAFEPEWSLLSRPRLSFDGRLFVSGLWHEAPMGSRNQSVKRVRVLTAAGGKAVCPDIPLPGVLVDSSVTADNSAVAAVFKGDTKEFLGVWDLATTRTRFEPIPLPGAPMSVVARPEKNQLAVMCITGELLVIDDKTGKRVLHLQHEAWGNDPGRALQVQYSPDGNTLVSLNPATPTSINVRDSDSGRLRFPPLLPTAVGANFHSVSISADSRFLATISLIKNHVQVWDLATGCPASEPLLHPGDYWGLFSVRFSPDGRHLLTSNKDGQTRYWDWRAAKLACPPMEYDNDVMDAAITPDGCFALTAVRGRQELQFWELATGRRLAPPVRLGPRDGSSSLTVSITPDGTRAIVGSLPSDLTVVDLEVLLSPPAASTNDLVLLAELATSRRIELGDLSGLTTDQWLVRWDSLQKRNPELPRSFLHKTVLDAPRIRRPPSP
jgi:serine/threonine protein kinase/WD40 repeat protein